MGIGVIIPVYNSEQYIIKLLNMLEPQLNMLDEVIFVDDGSTDSGPEILASWADGRNNVKLVYQKNAGASVARQKGLDLIHSKYVTFLDSDDVISTDYFMRISEIIKMEPNCDMYVLSYVTYFSEKNKLPRINKEFRYECGCDYVKSIVSGDTIGDAALWNHVYDMEFLNKNNIKFDCSAKIAEDCLFNDLCALWANRVYVSDYCGYTWMCDHDSLTKRCPLNMGETLNKHKDYIIEINEKYGLSNSRVSETEKWAFKYLINNIMNSNYDEKVKSDLLNNALKKNISLATIDRLFSGFERALLKKSYTSDDFRYYRFYLDYSLKTLFTKTKGCIYKLFRRSKFS